MTPKERAAMQQSLEALEIAVNAAGGATIADREAITALREALAKPKRYKHQTASAWVANPLAEQAECKECGAKQAQIDRLMLEYCPDEMTTEQMQEWGNNQRPAEQAEQEPVAIIEKEAGFETEVYATGHAASLPDGVFKLYTHPIRTKDLADDEIDKVLRAQEGNLNEQWFFSYARAVIAADREKNK